MSTLLRGQLHFLVILFCSLGFIFNCLSPGLYANGIAGDSTIQLHINPDITHQTIRHFGASDTWSCQFVGKWPDAKKNAIADLLFSNEPLATGGLKGIGLSLWRFNVGSGSTEQGDASGIKDDWRRTESFRKADGTYDWDKQAGQLWFMSAAKERGVNEFLIFPNTPPVHLTVNGKGYASNGQPNLKPERFGDFSNFLADIVDGIRNRTGITFQYISPINEPQWDWSHAGQEGTPFLNDHVASVTSSLSAALLKRKLPTQIVVAEAAQIDYLYSDFGMPARGTNIHTFFDKNSAHYLGSLPNLHPVISGHSYLTTSPFELSEIKRKQLASAVKKVPGLDYWMTEYCVLGDNEGEIKGEGRDLTIHTALYVARVIHNDLANANASAWHWWLAVSPYDYKDGLVYIDKNKEDGSFQTSKMLWALGNFSAFIRPGAVRIELSGLPGNPDLLASSYKNTTGEIVTVLVNSGMEQVNVSLALPTGKLHDVKQYETSADKDLVQTQILKEGNNLTINAKSIVTVIGKIHP